MPIENDLASARSITITSTAAQTIQPGYKVISINNRGAVGSAIFTFSDHSANDPREITVPPGVIMTLPYDGRGYKGGEIDSSATTTDILLIY